MRDVAPHIEMCRWLHLAEKRGQLPLHPWGLSSPLQAVQQLVPLCMQPVRSLRAAAQVTAMAGQSKTRQEDYIIPASLAD